MPKSIGVEHMLSCSLSCKPVTKEDFFQVSDEEVLMKVLNHSQLEALSRVKTLLGWLWDNRNMLHGCDATKTFHKVTVLLNRLLHNYR